MKGLTEEGSYTIPQEALGQLLSLFYGGFADHQETSSAIKKAYDRHGYLIDSHTAVGYSVLEKYRGETGDSALTLGSTASPCKFNQAVLEALGRDISGRDEFSLLEEGYSWRVQTPWVNPGTVP